MISDADAAYRRAVDAGAETIEAPLDTPYNTWQIATRREG